MIGFTQANMPATASWQLLPNPGVSELRIMIVGEVLLLAKRELRRDCKSIK
jgi:hypothetical protein